MPQQVLADPARHQEAERPEVEVVADRPAPGVRDDEALDALRVPAAETLSVPGLTFAEHGPRDLGLTYGYLERRADPPLPPEVVAAGVMVLELTEDRGMFFLDNVVAGESGGQIDPGVMIGPGGGRIRRRWGGSTVRGGCLGSCTAKSLRPPEHRIRDDLRRGVMIGVGK